MNSKVFVDSQLAFLKHILNLMDQKASLSIPLYRLKEIDEVMARKNAKESILGKSDTQFSNLQNRANNLSYENIQVNNSTIKSEMEEEIKVTETQEFKFEPKKIVEEKLLHPEVSVEKVEKEIKDRRDKILRILTTGGGSIREIASKMGDVNEKTLQRDLLELMRDKKVIMLGKKRWAKYYLK
jgi:predicted HTH transcriptional regulator